MIFKRISKTEFQSLAKDPGLPEHNHQRRLSAGSKIPKHWPQREWWADQARSRLGVLVYARHLKWWFSVVMASNRQPIPITLGRAFVFVVDMDVSDTRKEALIKLHGLLSKKHYL